MVLGLDALVASLLLRIREADYASRTQDPQQFTEHSGPIPGAHKTDSKSHTDQVKSMYRNTVVSVGAGVSA